MPLVTGGEIATLDPHYESVPLLLSCNGSHGATNFVDNSLHPVQITVFGNVQISSAQSKFDGASAYFNGTDAYLGLPGGSTPTFGTNDFTIESWLYAIAPASGRYQTIVSNAGTHGIFINSSGQLIWYSAGDHCASTVLSAAAWHHIAAVHIGGVINLYVDGVRTATTATLSSAFSITTIGGHGGEYFDGYLDDLRVTSDVARYTADFTPPAVEFPWLTPQAYAMHGFASALGRRSTGTESELTRSRPAVIGFASSLGTGLDIHFGGIGQITGTVKNSPATPVQRRVVLIDEATHTIIRETWSNPITGAYAFTRIALQRIYTVLAYDYKQTYRAVIADRIMPELMS